ncbi:tetratricopeptide repeat protein [Hydrogenovibrio sp. 3SP14C1]|uniref:tetratricopeptide repeat protein n=1 Tax=Hydrogenovibrio sp. 3SP14C1 TaxID=3038774 RepID=UPI0024162CB9|nr:tetratricopeptide repeat protein [Hydrogenovibrio sp. 3SP14C1]MDG4812293.1 tetratricopeptide repeat protein [Hydrogenovibrio sp. 3SP14C1]
MNKYLILMAAFLFLLSGCSSEPKKLSGKPKSSVPMEEVKPLAKDLTEEDEYEFALDLARMKIEQEHYAKAYSLLKKLKQFKPEDIRIYRLLSTYYEKQGNLEMAFISSQQTLKNPYKTIQDEQKYARYALLNENYVEADKIYQAWLDRTGSQTVTVIALNNLGFSALLQKDFDKAQSYFLRALKLDPLNEKARNNLKLIQSIQTDQTN